MPIVSGVYSGLRYIRYPMTPAGATKLEKDIEKFTRDLDDNAIVSITLLPSELVPVLSEGSAQVKEISRTITLKGYFYDPLNDPLENNVYIPKNAKMFTAPYMFTEVNAQTDKTIYRIEKFALVSRENMQDEWRDSIESGIGVDFGSFSLTASAGVSPTPDIVVRPTNVYDNANGKMNAFVIKGFPQLPYVIDSYRAYVASQGGELGLGMKNLFSAIVAIGGMGVGASNLMGAIPARLSAQGIRDTNAANSGLYHGANGVTRNASNLVSQASDLYVNTHRGDYARGVTDFSVGMIGNRSRNIYINQVGINLCDAKKIDNFFSMYGYAVNQIEVPTYNARPVWNYIKTRQLNVTGEMPNEAIDKIKSIFNEGITFWKNINTMLDYSQDNSPVTN